MSRIGIVDYGLGNLTSVAGAVRHLGHQAIVASDYDVLEETEKLILPGVGAFGDGMRNLRDRGLVEGLTRLVLEQAKPILGICLGSQLLARESHEFGRHDGLGWIDAKILRLPATDADLRIPHVGWNSCEQAKTSLLFEGIPEDALFYYVHSYYIAQVDDARVLAHCEYGIRFPAVVSRNNIYATQFHPEKSQLYGLELLRNFLDRA